MDRVLTGAEMKACDEYTINKLGVPSEELMERAADALCIAVCRVAEDLKLNRSAKIIVFCGPGNNGGDGYACARLLYEEGFEVETYFVSPERKMSEGCSRERTKAIEAGVNELLAADCSYYDIIVDAIFGIGLSRVLDNAFAEAVDMINDSGKYVISADIPSGVCSDTGRILGVAVEANETVSFAYAKRGHLLYPGRTHTGTLYVLDIGINTMALDMNESSVSPTVFTSMSKPPFPMPHRLPDSNKGSYGRVLVVGGAVNMAGAAFLSAKAAYRTGAGLVRVFTAEENREIIQTLLPEAVLATYGACETGDYSRIKTELRKAIAVSDVLIVGPGLSQNGEARAILDEVLMSKNIPMIIDADALNLLSSDSELMSRVPRGTVITPHMGEMARLTGKTIGELKQKSIENVIDFSSRYGVVCVMKDATTAVAFDGKVYLNCTGNNGMSKGGAGDVLTGIIGGLVAQGLSPFSAACDGVYLHGLAGDICAERLGEYSILARELADAVSDAIRKSI